MVATTTTKSNNKTKNSTSTNKNSTTITTTTTTTTTNTNTSTNTSSNILRFEDGAVQFRLRIIVSLLSYRPLLIKNIRVDDIDRTGLVPCEISFLRLIDSITNGTKIEINSTGTQLRFFPGILTGGTITHNCPVAPYNENNNTNNNKLSNDDVSTIDYRSIGWYLEGILPLAPFGKEPLQVRFTGITDGTCNIDPSVDYWQRSAIPLMMKQFHIGISYDATNTSDFMGPQPPSIKIIQRGGYPHGGGIVTLYCPIIIKELHSIDNIDPGKIKRIRGNAISTKIISSSTTARIAYAAKGLCHRLLPDVWIHTDVHTITKHSCGPDPTVSLILTAESTTGVVLTSECCLNNNNNNNNNTKELPEDMGIRGAAMLLEEIRRGGCIDTTIQSIVLLWMCLTPEDVSRIRIGSLSSYTIQSLRLYQTVFGVTFKVTPDPTTKTIILSCLGTGYRNMARAST